MTLNIRMKNVDVILGNGEPLRFPRKEGYFHKSMEATIKAMLGTNDNGARMQGTFAVEGPEKMATVEKILE